MTADLVARRFFLVLLLASLVLLALVVRPLASALFLAAILAGFLWPVYVRLVSRFRQRRGLAASVFVLGVVILLVGPTAWFSAFVVREGVEALRFLSEAVRADGVSGLLERLPGPIARATNALLDRLPREPGETVDAAVQQQVSAYAGRAAAAVGAALSATGVFLFQTAMMLVALFFLLVHGEDFVDWLDRISPLRPGQTRELLAEFKRVSYAVIMSSAITAAVQAIAALVGYIIARVPHPFFFTGLTFVLAFIPAIGAAVVSLAAAVLLVLSGHPYAALFLAIWGLLVVGLVDNVVKPYLLRAGMQMRGGVVFFALIGGLAAFGPVGLLLGPLVVALFLALLRMYDRDFRTRDEGGVPSR